MVCYVSGTFVWYAPRAAGGTLQFAWRRPNRRPFGPTIRSSDSRQPAVVRSLATNGGTTETQSGSEAAFALNANQPLEVELFGHAGAGPGYSVQAGGRCTPSSKCPTRQLAAT